MRSDNVKKGIQQAPHRSLFYALGFTKEELERPLIGIVSSFNEIVPGHMNLDKITDAVKQGVLMVSTSCCSSPSGVHRLCTVIRFCVIVPVLSTQRTEMAPRVSTDGSLRTSECFLASLQAPRERKTVRITGNSSGIIAIASVIPESTLSVNLSTGARDAILK